jgi:hypothetical protein
MFTSMGGHQLVRIVGKSMWFSLDDLRNMNELYTIYIYVYVYVYVFSPSHRMVL